MKPLNHILTWILELLSLLAIFTLLCLMVPDEYFYSAYVDKYGFVDEVTWSDACSLVLLIAAVLINCGVIWFTILIVNKVRGSTPTHSVVNPAKRAVLSVLKLLLLSSVYNLLYSLLPDEELFALYERNYGATMENQWYTSYMMSLMLVSVLLCSGAIGLASALSLRRKSRFRH